jgi:hypothetical protein
LRLPCDPGPTAILPVRCTVRIKKVPLWDQEAILPVRCTVRIKKGVAPSKRGSIQTHFYNLDFVVALFLLL